MLPTRLRTLLVLTSFLFAIALTRACPAAADWPTDGTSGLPVCTNTATQDYPNICSDGVGGVYIAWSDARTPTGIYGQHLNALGQPLWPANGILLASSNASYRPPIVADGTGGFFMHFAASSNVFAQRFDAAGAKLWGASGVAICTAAGTQVPFDIFPDGSGGAVMGWHDQRSGSRLFAQRVNSAGVAQWAGGTDGVPADLTAQSIGDYSFAPDGTGGMLLSWDMGTQLWIQRIDGTGTRQWGDEGINVAFGPSWTNHPTVVSDGAAGAIVEWWDSRASVPTDRDDLYAKRYDASGTQLWSPVTGAPVVEQTGMQRWSNMVSDGAGGAIVAWLDFRTGFPSNRIYAQRINPSGAGMWATGGVPLTMTPSVDHYYAPIAMAQDGTGGAVMTWADFRNGASNPDIRTLRVGSSGTSPWGSDGVGVCSQNSWQYNPAIASDGNGSAVAVWADLRPGSQFDIYASRLDASGAIGPPIATATQVALVSSDATAERVRLVWYATESAGLAATLERTIDGVTWRDIARLSADGTGRLAYDDTDILAGSRYGYRLRLAQGERTAESWIEVPRAAFTLHGVRPTPSIGPASIEFSLPDAAHATLELFDVGGRRIGSHPVGSLGAGRHSFPVDRHHALEPGVYLVRLARGSDVRSARMVVTER
jgi:hypothetical protein